MENKVGWVVLALVIISGSFIVYPRITGKNIQIYPYRYTSEEREITTIRTTIPTTVVTTETPSIRIWDPEKVECPDLHTIFNFHNTVNSECSCLWQGSLEIEGWKVDSVGRDCCGLNFDDNYFMTCYKGRSTGENINYFYCRGIYLEKKFIDEYGNIQDTILKSADLVYDSSGNYIKTICNHKSPFGTYEFIDGSWQKD